MITHIVCWKYKPGTTDEQQATHIASLRELPSLIPDIESYLVGADIMHLDRSFDTGLVAIYRDMAALDAYTRHPEHQRVVAIGKEITEQVMSVDFETEG
ncbi:MAG: Dabb family protein [Pyrinomonadaceae bacterium]